MSKLIYPGVVKNDFRVLVTEINENANMVNYRWYLPPEQKRTVDLLVKEFEHLCGCAESRGEEPPQMWKFLKDKGLKLYLCPWCDN